MESTFDLKQIIAQENKKHLKHRIRVLIVVLYFQGINPEEAYLLAKTAVQQKKRSRFWGLFLERDLYGEGYANQAWARILLYDRIEAHRLLKRAFRWASSRSKHNLTGIHLRAGHVWLRDGNRQKAREHFKLASEMDVQGEYGKKAAKALFEI